MSIYPVGMTVRLLCGDGKTTDATVIGIQIRGYQRVSYELV